MALAILSGARGTISTYDRSGHDWRTIGEEIRETTTSLDVLQDLFSAHRASLAHEPCRFEVWSIPEEGKEAESFAVWETYPLPGWRSGFYPDLEILASGDVIEVWPSADVAVPPIYVPLRDGAYSDYVEYVYIPPAIPMLGTEKRKVPEGGYWMARTVVTERQWDPTGNYNDEGLLPKTMVSWDDCQAWCKKHRVSMPDEWQWEYAARGTDGRTYPWGEEEPNDELLCWSGTTSRSAPEKVGSHPKGASPFGLYDMAGLVWQWTVTPWTDKPQFKNYAGVWVFDGDCVRIPLRVEGTEVTLVE